MSAAEPARPRIIDAHCHIASEDIIPRSFVDGTVANLEVALVAQGIAPTSAKLASLYQRKLHDPLCDELVAEMAEAGIEKSILLAADFTWALPDCALTVEEAFLRHAEVLRRHPGKFEVFGGVDPRWGKDGLALLERGFVELGFRGFKVYPPCGFSPSDPALLPFYELCAAHHAPVVVHIGPTSPALAFDTANPFLLDAAARMFPTVSFILAHGSVSYREECAMLCGYRPNVYLDISGYQGEPRAEGKAAAVRAAVSRGINHKILFGTDWPVYRMQGTQAREIEAILADDGPLADLTDRELDLVLHGNAARLLADGR